MENVNIEYTEEKSMEIIHSRRIIQQYLRYSGIIVVVDEGVIVKDAEKFLNLFLNNGLNPARVSMLKRLIPSGVLFNNSSYVLLLEELLVANQSFLKDENEQYLFQVLMWVVLEAINLIYMLI